MECSFQRERIQDQRVVSKTAIAFGDAAVSRILNWYECRGIVRDGDNGLERYRTPCEREAGGVRDFTLIPMEYL
ncbi:hypothetical protein E2C01_026786 [Portunus trituberculatus]|uniref:Uncharacterized protein n=1 Tax=Portunus trituberculatus TaxID=210409 RepID=A0A5B7EJQ9_PORTR|nr:hypothetical protein [Portunus trituberculatus]